MLKKIFSNQTGLTFIELMMAIAIIVIISAISVVYIKGDVKDEVELFTDQLAADIRYTRNLAVSKTVYNFSAASTYGVDGVALGDVYPPGGYGVYIDRTTGTYTIFADSGLESDGDPIGYDGDKDVVIKIVTIDNNSIELGDLNDPSVTERYFTFKSENEVDTDMEPNSYGVYALEVDYFAGYDEDSYRGILKLGEIAEEGYVWVSLGKSFNAYVTPEPNPEPDEDPASLFQG